MKTGITGHQDLGTSQTGHWVAQEMATVVDQIGVSKGFSCLAKGADQLFAQILQNKQLPFIAVIPCVQIESSFQTEEDRTLFRRLLATASETITLPFDAPSEVAYFEAGKTVVDQSDLLIAVWNGRAAKGLGGTADVVKYALENSKKVIHINLVARKVIELGREDGARLLPGLPVQTTS
jgi:hypothetical protein